MSGRNENVEVWRGQRDVDSLWSIPLWIFMSRKDISWVACPKVNLILGRRFFMTFFMD